MRNIDDEQAIEQLVTVFVEGWNSQDGDTCARPFAPNADFTAVTGLRARGRDVIARGHKEILSTVFRGTRMSGKVNDVAFLRPDVAVADVTFYLESTAEIPWLPRYTSCGMVATKEDGAWSIAVFRNLVPFGRPEAGPIDRELLRASRIAAGVAS